MNRSNNIMHQKNTMKLSDFPFAEVGVENFKFGQRERHYDSSKSKTFTLLIILLAAIIVISHGTVAPTSSAVISGGMIFCPIGGVEVQQQAIPP